MNRRYFHIDISSQINSIWNHSSSSFVQNSSSECRLSVKLKHFEWLCSLQSIKYIRIFVNNFINRCWISHLWLFLVVFSSLLNDISSMHLSLNSNVSILFNLFMSPSDLPYVSHDESWWTIYTLQEWITVFSQISCCRRVPDFHPSIRIWWATEIFIYVNSLNHNAMHQNQI